MTRKLLIAMLLFPAVAAAQSKLSDAVTAEVESQRKVAQVMTDKVFSFGELGFQEIETSKYLTGILRQNGFRITNNISGMPTAWRAEWGSGKPVIALGSDIDAIPGASQKPGVAFHSPIVEGGPGHGEGHNSGEPLNIIAAIALKKVMEREHIAGTIVIWPGVAEELAAGKAWFVRDGLFTNVDAVLFAHVDDSFDIAWGQPRGTGLVSVEFEFFGEAAHAGSTPWRGRSALDAVELMNVGWNYRREHLRPEQRSHYVITDGGKQPNVVPDHAAVWYYIRELDYAHLKQNYDIAIEIAEAAAKMTNTEMKYHVVGNAYPRHFNKPIAEAMHRHAEEVGMPNWTPEDQQLARAVQKLVNNTDTSGLMTTVEALHAPQLQPESGGSDDIGDVSWVVPTATLRYPANIPGATGHHWSSAIAMATPIAHKGVVAGAKVMALTALDLILDPKLLGAAKDYFAVQTKDVRYTPFIGARDPAPIHLNDRVMSEFRPLMQRFYYDETKFDTYLQQLGIKYPTLK